VLHFKSIFKFTEIEKIYIKNVFFLNKDNYFKNEKGNFHVLLLFPKEEKLPKLNSLIII
jgi:hypothetical protein